MSFFYEQQEKMQCINFLIYFLRNIICTILLHIIDKSRSYQQINLCMNQDSKQLNQKQEQDQLIIFNAPSSSETQNPLKNQTTQAYFQQRYCSYFLKHYKQITGLEITNNFLRNQQYLRRTRDILYRKMLAANFTFTKRIYGQQSNKPQFLIKIYQSSSFYNFLQIQITYCNIRKSYKVLNQLKQSHRHQNMLVGFGSFSNVYDCNSFGNDPIVVKCLKYDEQCIDELKNHIKQFFVYDIMSALEVGPKIILQHSFDFILFNNCIQFHIEKCYPIDSSTVQKDIKESLMKMHYFHFVHSDIKPTNIMYSKTLNKNVLIDFGTAQFIDQKIGQKTQTSFKGTYEFCGDQIKQIFLKIDVTPVDMYYNDLQMLQKSLQFISIKQKEKYETFESIKKKNKQNEVILLKKQLCLMFKYQLYKESKFVRYSQRCLALIQNLKKYQIRQTIQQVIKEGIKFVNTFSHKDQIRNTHRKILNNLIQTYLSNKYFYHEQESIMQNQKNQNQQINFLLNNKSNQNSDDQEINYLLKNKQKFHRIYHLLTDCPKIFGQIGPDEISITPKISQLKKLSADEIQTIIFSKTQSEPLQIQQIFTLFILYVSFWKSSFKVEINKKQKVACLVKQLIFRHQITCQMSYSLINDSCLKCKKKNSQQSGQDILGKYFNSKSGLYLKDDRTFAACQCSNLLIRKLFKNVFNPQIEFVVQQCPNIVYVYQHLLGYCLSGEFNLFKKEFMLQILKNSIILNFKYIPWINDYVFNYLIGLIKLKQKQLVTRIIIQFYQIIFLTKNNFYCDSSVQLKDLQQKKLNHRKILQSTINFISINKEEVQNSLSIVFSILSIRNAIQIYEDFHQKYLSNRKLQQLEKFRISNNQKFIFVSSNLRVDLIRELELDQSNEGQTNFQLANFYIQELYRVPSHSKQCYSSHDRVLKKLPFDIRVLNKHNQCFYINSQLTDLIKRQLQAFDKSVNCQSISKTFHLIDRSFLSTEENKVEQILNILQLICRYEKAFYFNYKIIIQAHRNLYFPQIIQIIKHRNQNQLNQYNPSVINLKKLHSIEDQIITLLKNDQFQLNYVLQKLEPILYRQNQKEKSLFYSNKRYQFFYQLFHQLPFLSSKLYLLFILKNYYQEFYSFNFLKTIILMLQFFEQIFTTNLLFQKSNNNSRDLLIKIQTIIFLQLNTKRNVPQLIVKWWKNKILFTFVQTSSLYKIDKYILFSLASQKKFKQLSELIITYFLNTCQCREDLIKFLQFQTFFREISRINSIRAQFYTQFLINYQQVKKVVDNPLKMLPVYFCLLEFHQFLEKDKKMFKKITKQMCVKFDKLSVNKIIDPTIISQFRNFTYIMSIRYLKLIVKKNNKIEKQIKNHCRIKLENISKKQDLFKIYLKSLKTSCKRAFANNKKENNVNLTKINRKIDLIRQNCNIKQQFFVQNFKDQEQRFYYRANLFTKNSQKKQVLFGQDFKNQFDIKDLLFFISQGLFDQYVLIRQIKDTEPLKAEQKMIILNKKIIKIKTTQQYRLAQQSIQLLNRILQARGNRLRAQFQNKFQTNNINPDMIPIGLFYAKFAKEQDFEKKILSLYNIDEEGKKKLMKQINQ